MDTPDERAEMRYRDKLARNNPESYKDLLAKEREEAINERMAEIFDKLASSRDYAVELECGHEFCVIGLTHLLARAFKDPECDLSLVKTALWGKIATVAEWEIDHGE